MTMDEFKNIIRKGFVVLTILLYIFWVIDLFFGDYTLGERIGEFLYLIIPTAISFGIFIPTIKTDIRERNYPHKWFAYSLGMYNLLGYIIWIAIRPKKVITEKELTDEDRTKFWRNICIMLLFMIIILPIIWYVIK